MKQNKKWGLIWAMVNIYNVPWPEACVLQGHFRVSGRPSNLDLVYTNKKSHLGIQIRTSIINSATWPLTSNITNITLSGK